MRVPKHFQVTERDTLFGLINNHPLGVLVTTVDGRLEATHVPCLLDTGHGDLGRLRFHLARPTPAAAALADAGELLVMFTGAKAYVSPDWYQSPNMVPTWNYASVHVYGHASELHDATLCLLLEDLSAAEESKLDKPDWTVSKVETDQYARMRRAIVGFELAITEVQGKWKLGQNRSRDDRRGVAAALGNSDADHERAMAELVNAVD